MAVMKQGKQTISSREEVIKVVDRFYSKVRQDELIGPIFTEQAKVDWDEHLPKLYNFWEDLLFGTENYHGRPFPPHMKFNLKIEHFERWLKLFVETIDENFSGLKAEEMKARALRIAQNFLRNIEALSNP
jgi:hemoglobin